MATDSFILVTGGAGYIGSHTVVELIQGGYNVVVVDNMSNSNEESLRRVAKITGTQVPLHNVDLRDKEGLNKIFEQYKVSSVIHFAGLKAVGESVSKPLEYYDNNLVGTLVLLDVMRAHNVKKLVFSSSATVYGVPKTMPVTEDFPLSCTNPYGRTKLFIEEILRDLCTSDDTWSVILLRYFNPVGAHISGTIGESPNGIPNNLCPYITQVAVGKREFLSVYGNDYTETKDGTGVRDFLHVTDLAVFHVKAIEKIVKVTGCTPVNLGTGTGYSVLEMVEAFKKASGREIPYKIVPRRSGDVAVCYADPSFANSFLGYKAQKGLKEMCEDSWRWQVTNPNGYDA